MSRAAQVVNDYRLFLFDLDGTLIEAYMDADDPNEAFPKVVPIHGSPQAISGLKSVGKWVGVITNQGGVDHQHVTEDEWKTKMRGAEELLQPDAWFVCYGTPNGVEHKHREVFIDRNWDPARRKPNPAMIFEAMQHFQVVNFHEVVFVGDMPTDERCAANAGVDFIWAEDFFA